MQIEDIEGDDEEESLAKGDNSEVKAEKEPKVEQSALKANDKPARRMKIQEVESDDEECEEIVINGHASKKEQTENSSKQLNGGVSDAAKVDKDIGKVKNEGMDNSKEVTKNDKETIGRKSPVAVEDVTIETSEKQSEFVPIERPVFYTKELPSKCTGVKEEATAYFKSGQYGEASQKYLKLIEQLQKGTRMFSS